MAEKEFTFGKTTDKTYDGSPIYDVFRGGVLIGRIERVRASTDTKIKGTRLRREGKGRNEFRPKIERGWPAGLSYLTRTDAAFHLAQEVDRDGE